MNLFKLLRYERGLTIGEVASGAGVSRPTISALEAAEQPKPSAPVARALADFYGISVAELLGVSRLDSSDVAA